MKNTRLGLNRLYTKFFSYEKLVWHDNRHAQVWANMARSVNSFTFSMRGALRIDEY